MILEKIISGGQTGADQAAIIAASRAGIATGGWAAQGWQTEDGPAPTLAEYGLLECPTRGYPARTRLNVRDSDGTLLFLAEDSPGSNLTWRQCERQKKPFRGILMGAVPGKGMGLLLVAIEPPEIAGWIIENNIRVLNVAGNRESKAPGIGKAVEKYLAAVFTELRKR